MSTQQTQSTVGTSYRPFDSDFDAYATFAQLRADAPAHFVEDLGLWVVSRYEDIRAIFGDAETFANALTLAPVTAVCPHAGAILGGLTVDPVLAGGDGPSHARTRRAVMATFPASPRRASAYEPVVRAIADDLVEQMGRAGTADLVRGFAWELPLLVMLTLLDVPPRYHERIKRWSDGRMALVWGAPSDEEQARLATDLVAFWGFCQDLVAQRMADPGGDLLSALVKYRDGDDGVLTEREIASILFDFLAAGHETMSNVLCNGVLALLRTGTWSELVADPARITSAAEEMLRYDTSNMGWLRCTTRPACVGGVEIPAGARIVMLLGSANRDERRFEGADEFDIARENASAHLSFGVGRHFCPGAALSRLQIRVGLEALTAGLEGLRLCDGFEPSYEPSIALHALRTLPVEWGAGLKPAPV
jgi:cytochrome P450